MAVTTTAIVVDITGVGGNAVKVQCLRQCRTCRRSGRSPERPADHS